MAVWRRGQTIVLTSLDDDAAVNGQTVVVAFERGEESVVRVY